VWWVLSDGVHDGVPADAACSHEPDALHVWRPAVVNTFAFVTAGD
jgi:hypothetical protein